jgi:Protein of unknown function (DUF3891)
MFRSKIRPLIIAQAEHGKLAGALAFLWGNDHFDPPPLDRSAFVTGVELHDRGYGYLDNDGIGEVTEDRWMAITRAGFYQELAEPAAELLIKLHLQRLTSYGNSPPRQALLAELSAASTAYAQQYALDLALWQRVDRITNLCDSIAFDFCFEQPTTGQVAVYPQNDQPAQVAIHYAVAEDEIRVTPWPFAVECYQGYLIAYQQDHYPARLAPVLRPFRLAPGG